jgi:hypothetical protein
MDGGASRTHSFRFTRAAPVAGSLRAHWVPLSFARLNTPTPTLTQIFGLPAAAGEILCLRFKKGSKLLCSYINICIYLYMFLTLTMKYILFLVLCLLCCSFSTAPAEPLKLTLPLILGLIVGFYEVIIRLVPTVGQYAVIGKIIDILKWISDFLNRKKSISPPRS